MLTSRQSGSAIQCKITYDLETGKQPIAGEYLASHGKKGISSAYLILGVRLVRPRKPRHGNRWMLTCQRCNLTDLIEPGAMYWSLYWYPRDRNRQPKTMKGTKR